MRGEKTKRSVVYFRTDNKNDMRIHTALITHGAGGLSSSEIIRASLEHYLLPTPDPILTAILKAMATLVELQKQLAKNQTDIKIQLELETDLCAELDRKNDQIATIQKKLRLAFIGTKQEREAIKKSLNL